MQGGRNFHLQNSFGTLGKSFVSSEKTLGIVIIPWFLIYYDPMCAFLGWQRDYSPCLLISINVFDQASL